MNWHLFIQIWATLFVAVGTMGAIGFGGFALFEDDEPARIRWVFGGLSVALALTASVLVCIRTIWS